LNERSPFPCRHRECALPTLLKSGPPAKVLQDRNRYRPGRVDLRPTSPPAAPKCPKVGGRFALYPPASCMGCCMLWALGCHCSRSFWATHLRVRLIKCAGAPAEFKLDSLPWSRSRVAIAAVERGRTDRQGSGCRRSINVAMSTSTGKPATKAVVQFGHHIEREMP